VFGSFLEIAVRSKVRGAVGGVRYEPTPTKHHKS
jgi:hypothetical protein